MEDLREKFKVKSGIDNFQRVENSHILPWYVGIDNNSRYSLFVITESKPEKISSTKLINVFVGKRHDDTYGITFSLIDDKFFDLFIHFCEDMIEASKSVPSSSKGADFICARFILWQKIFSKSTDGLLSFEEVKGLIGELCFLKKKMIPAYGEEKGLQSWSGIEMTDRDFTCDDTWYEVKSTVSGSGFVKISSVEQLDFPEPGHLAVITLDKTSEGDASRITLNGMYHLMIETFDSDVLKENFISRMLAYGYFEDSRYEKYCFKYNGMSIYKVDDKFPCIRRKNIPVSAQNVKYDLDLAMISTFKEE